MAAEENCGGELAHQPLWGLIRSVDRSWEGKGVQWRELRCVGLELEGGGGFDNCTGPRRGEWGAARCLRGATLVVRLELRLVHFVLHNDAHFVLHNACYVVRSVAC